MIIVIGSLNLDLVVNTRKIPRPGETVMGKDFKQISGGKGGNQADAAAKLGGEVTMIGAIGNDEMGKILKNSLKNDGVNVENVITKPDEPTGIAVIIVEDSGDNSITVAPGANYMLNSKDIENVENVIKKGKVVLIQLENKIDTVKTSLKIGRESGAVTILNPAPAVELDEEILKYVDIITPNETELEILTGVKTDSLENVEKAGKLLLQRGIKEIVVTLGEKGCMWINSNIVKHYPAYMVKAIDTTGAGDSFNGALAVSIDNGGDMETSILYAMKVGAMTVTKEGAQTSLPLKEEVENFKKWYDDMRILKGERK